MERDIDKMVPKRIQSVLRLVYAEALKKKVSILNGEKITTFIGRPIYVMQIDNVIKVERRV